MSETWDKFADAIHFAVSRIEGDQGPLNDRERADGHQYVLRMLATTTSSSTLRLDAERPSFLQMLDATRFVGAAGPDIDYDVAAVKPGGTYRIVGLRGEASFVGIAVYAGGGATGASEIVLGVDIDEIVGLDGRFVYEFTHPDASRVIVRQYFHDRASQRRGEWTIERVDLVATGQAAYPSALEMDFRIANATNSMRWTAQLNELWPPELRRNPNNFVRQTSHDIVAAIPNPDVTYSTSWWWRDEDEVVVIDVRPPETRYWAVQLCDRWIQCYPDRRSNLNDRQVEFNADGSVRIVIADGDPGHPNWLDAGGHRTGVVFFRWLHADVEAQPTCRVVKRADLPSLS